MQVDENEFFREATLRICGSLDVETFLYNSFMYIRRFIPADTVFLTHFNRQKGEHIALARSSEEGGSLLNLSVSMPSEIRPFVVRTDKKSIAVDRAETHPTAQPWIVRGLLDKDSSLLVVRLVMDGHIVGGVIFVAQESARFTQGHADLLSLLREPFAVALSNSIRYREVLELKELLAEDNRFLHSELRQIAGEEIIGADFGLRGVMEMVRQVAPLTSPVMLLGETGTGKEVIAGAIHNLSPRKDEPFITVNCGAIPETLIDSELFGHEKGAFTGAISRKRGRFERAHGGTIFLDEVGELQLDAQVRLLRVLQEKEIERVGGTEPIKVDIRVIAATNRDLETMIRDGKFREDLYFRLEVFPIDIPPLRDRKGDIPLLVQHFAQKKSREMGLGDMPTLTSGSLDRLMAYHWPGNIRELENAVERALIVSKGGILAFDDIHVALKPEHEYDSVAGPRTHPDLKDPDSLELDLIVSRHIRHVLELTGGKVGGDDGAAKVLKINPSTLRKRMRKLGIPFGRKSKKDQ
jgi:transcriptional regulator with GAF, ATPase, and Fis domain